MERIDFIFSYWIFAWYLLYAFKIVNYNPRFALIIGIIENIFMLGLMFYYKTEKQLVLYFIIMVFLLKIIPIYTIWNHKVYNKDRIATILLFIIFLGWRIINHKSITNFVQEMKQLIVYNKNTLPGMSFLEKLFK